MLLEHPIQALSLKAPWTASLHMLISRCSALRTLHAKFLWCWKQHHKVCYSPCHAVILWHSCHHQHTQARGCGFWLRMPQVPLDSGFSDGVQILSVHTLPSYLRIHMPSKPALASLGLWISSWTSSWTRSLLCSAQIQCRC